MTTEQEPTGALPADAATQADKQAERAAAAKLNAERYPELAEFISALRKVGINPRVTKIMTREEFEKDRHGQ